MRILWLRWTWRDFCQRWLQILATALILAIGIGAFAGVVGLREWREKSTDASLAAMRSHDLRVDLAEGAYLRTGRLRAALAKLPDHTVAAAEERLVAASQLDASRPGRPVLVPARVIGLPLRSGGQTVDRVAALNGRGLHAADTDRAIAVLDWNFAHHFDLPATGRVRLARLGTVPYVGQGVTPQHLLIIGESGMQGAQSALGTLYMPLRAVQRAVGRPDRVNELVLRLAPGADARRAEQAVASALRSALPNVGFRTTRGDEEAPQRILYRDARNDQKMFLVLAILILAGSMFAAFNLISRVVEAQRREIGIGMALGVDPRLLAVRPLVLGIQIALLGIALGIPVGIGLAEWIKGLMGDFFPLPVYADVFPTELFVIGSALGLTLPVLAAALPVRRAVAVAPIEAIRTGHRAARGAGAAGALRRLSLPGKSIAQLPLRNLARTPRRTLLTTLGLGAVITAVVAVLGMVDAIGGSADRHEKELLRSSPDRLQIELAAPEPTNGPSLRRVAAMPAVRAAEPGLVVAGSVRNGRAGIDVALSFVPIDSKLWRPSVEQGRATSDGILLARKAADDLGVGVGDSVVLQHPRRAGATLAMKQSRIRVGGIHASPVRAFAFIPAGHAAALGLGGLTNTITVLPRSGAGDATIQRALFGQPGIASVRPVRAEAESLATTVEAFTGAIQMVAAITLAMALMVAFTSTSVSLEERRREYATMFAFGLPPRSGLRVAMTESVVTGALGTIVGLALGMLVTTWVVSSLLPGVFPDLGTEARLSAATTVTTLAVGIVAVALAPLLTFRRMREMDIPSTLRVME